MAEDKKAHPDRLTIAWENWSLLCRPEWRPLKIEGDRMRGRMIIGNSFQTIMDVHWLRLDGRRFDFEEWLGKRLKKAGKFYKTDKDAPKPESFVSTGWIVDTRGASSSKLRDVLAEPSVAMDIPPRDKPRGVLAKEGRQEDGAEPRSLWYGFAPVDDLLLEIRLNPEMAEAEHKFVKNRSLPSLKVYPFDKPSLWSVFDVSFEVPAGYGRNGYRLNSGDISFDFTEGKDQRLIVRQVYPADVAMGKRPLAKWIEIGPYKERRKLKEHKDADISIDGKTALTGICREGWKRHAFPLAKFRPHKQFAAAVIDKRFNRILIADHNGTGSKGEQIVKDAIAGMNWHKVR